MLHEEQQIRKIVGNTKYAPDKMAQDILYPLGNIFIYIPEERIHRDVVGSMLLSFVYGTKYKRRLRPAYLYQINCNMISQQLNEVWCQKFRKEARDACNERNWWQKLAGVILKWMNRGLDFLCNVTILAYIFSLLESSELKLPAWT